MSTRPHIKTAPRRQKGLHEPRRLSATTMGKIGAAVEREARRFHVSKSFVIAVALADMFGITEQEPYDIEDGE